MLNSRSYVSFSVITSQNAPLNTKKNKKIRNSLLTILDKKFLKVNESELLAKNRAGYIETQKNVALAEQEAKVVLFSASDVDTYTQTEATTLATLFKGWAEEQVAIIIVSPRPFNLWLKRLPRDVQPILNTLYMGHVVEPATPQTGTMEQSGLNHSVLNILQ